MFKVLLNKYIIKIKIMSYKIKRKGISVNINFFIGSYNIYNI